MKTISLVDAVRNEGGTMWDAMWGDVRDAIRGAVGSVVWRSVGPAMWDTARVSAEEVL